MMQIMIVDCKRSDFSFIAVLAPEGCHISIKGFGHRNSNFVMNLKAHPAVCSFNGSKKLVFHIGGGQVENSFFREVWDRCGSLLVDRDSIDFNLGLLRQCLSQIRQVLRHCYSLVPTEYLRLVKRYSHDVRYDLYKKIVGGVGGDTFLLLLRQHNGVLIFLLLLERLNIHVSFYILVNGFCRSEKLKPLIKRVLHSYFHKQLLDHKVRDELSNGYWFLQCSFQTEMAIVRHKYLIRKAGLMVDPNSLKYPAIFHVVCEDIPIETLDNRSWFCVYRYLSEWAFDYVVKFKRDIEIVEGIWHFLLKNWAVAANNLNQYGEMLLDDMFSRCKNLNKVLDRNSRSEFFSESIFWGLLDHGNLMPELAFSPNCGDFGFGYPDLKLPQLFSGYVSEKVEIAPIVTVRQLIEEGKKMRHCVGQLAKEAYFGEKYYFSVMVKGQFLTLELEKIPFDIGYRISQLYGVENRECSKYEYHLVDRWLDDARVINEVYAAKASTTTWEYKEHDGIECIYDSLGPYYPIFNVRRVEVIG